jgi:hypothetical protein
MRAVSLLAFLLVCGLSAARAAEGTQSLTSLTGQAFEIKAVTLVPMESAQRGNSTVNYDTVIVTLQKGARVAVCYFSMVDWINASAAAFESTERCQVR